MAQLAGAVEYSYYFSEEGYDFPNECPVYDTKQSNSDVPSNAGALGNTEYPFVPIASSSTLAWNDST